jgi:hypothetical protein
MTILLFTIYNGQIVLGVQSDYDAGCFDGRRPFLLKTC